MNNPDYILKVWWQYATLFVYFSYFFYNIHTIIQSHSYSTFAEASLHLSTGLYYLELRNNFLGYIKILKFFDADPGSGMEKFGSGVNILDPQHWCDA